MLTNRTLSLRSRLAASLNLHDGRKAQQLQIIYCYRVVCE
jgi:hypothetical protein